jgi:two-component system sensor kinase
LEVWARASQGKVSAETVATEIRRPKENLQGVAQVLLAEGVRLLGAGEPDKASAVLRQAQEIVQKTGNWNTYTSPILAWLATALRQEGESIPEQPAGTRNSVLLHARTAARSALRLARRFQNDLPHALRENALLYVLYGHHQRARRYLDESLAVAERQGARYEYAQTLYARGEVGSRIGWPDSARDLAEGKRMLEGMMDSRVVTECGVESSTERGRKS